MIRALLGSGRARVAFAALALPFLVAGSWFLGGGIYIAAKAEVAQVLLERAWQKTIETGEVQKPWGWADTWPVAKISFPDRHFEAVVLDKASGQAMAFGPGLMKNMAPLGVPGTAVISAHNDTHFSFLGEVMEGETFQVETLNGVLVYEVLGAKIVDARKPMSLAHYAQPHLVLITCYPFKTLASKTPYRYLVSARLVEK